MNITQQGILTLLKSAVTQQPLPLPEGFELAAAEEQIRNHHIVALAYEGAQLCGISGADPVMRTFFLQYCRALQTSERQLQKLKQLYGAFEEKGIDYLPLKGSRMKHLYPRHELRTMGDADILIRMEQYEKIPPILLSLGFAEKEETDHELVWQGDGLYLELHKRVIPSYNQDYYAYFGDGWNLAAEHAGHCWNMTPEDEWIYLFTHFAKHFRDGGIGCRHVVDLWVYRRANPNLKEAYVREELRKLQLLEFYENTLRLMAVWFEQAEADEKTDFLTEFIFASGSWGQMESQVLSVVLRSSRNSVLGFSGKLTYFWKNTFPPVELLWGKYTILKKYPWLLPAVWLVRPFYKLLFERRSLEAKKKNMDSISREKLQEQERLLQYIGLDYHF